MVNPACFTELDILAFDKIALAHSLVSDNYNYQLSNRGYGIYGKTPPNGGILEIGFVEQNPVLLSGALGDFLVEENGIFIIPLLCFCTKRRTAPAHRCGISHPLSHQASRYLSAP